MYACLNSDNNQQTEGIFRPDLKFWMFSFNNFGKDMIGFPTCCISNDGSIYIQIHCILINLDTDINITFKGNGI